MLIYALCRQLLSVEITHFTNVPKLGGRGGGGGGGGQANFGNARMNVRAHEVASMKITLMMIMILVDNGDGEGKI